MTISTRSAVGYIAGSSLAADGPESSRLIKQASMHEKSRLPVEIPLLEGVEIDGAMFIRLLTLSDVQRFWAGNDIRYSFAAYGCPVTTGQLFLNEYEWIFATTKASLVRAFTRWTQAGIQCVWHDWVNDRSLDFDPAFSYLRWFATRAALRMEGRSEHQWTEKQEHEYQRDILLRTPETFRGWWTLKNLPLDMTPDIWLSSRTELFDAGLSPVEAAQRMQELTYDSFIDSSEEIVLLDKDGIDGEIRYWISEKESGADCYYGSRNEPT